MTGQPPASPQFRKKILRVLFISLLLDLISFTFILPLFPQLLEFYRNLETSNNLHGNSAKATLLNRILGALNAYKNAFARPINDRYDIVLLGGALGSLFSLLQAIASPFIGTLSDRYGRRRALLCSMVGNILSVALWVAAVDFRTFLASRVVGGLSEGNVQLALAIATDISDEKQRGATMALVGACFSIAFTFGPALGAALANMTTVAANPFATAAGFSLFLIVVETLYLYIYLPETLPTLSGAQNSTPVPTANGISTTTNEKPIQNKAENPSTSATTPDHPTRTNSHLLLNTTHLLFLLLFSGIEFSLSFTTYDLYGHTSRQNGRLLGFIGLVASVLQGSVTRRLHPLRCVQLGVFCCCMSFFLLARLKASDGEGPLYVAAAFLAATSATVVTGLNGLSSFEAGAGERGGRLGRHRSFGQVGRALGPLGFCSLYWWAGREVAYTVGGVGMAGVVGLVALGLRMPVVKGR